jgi:hypothetical protein
MKQFFRRLRRMRLRQTDISQLDDRVILANLYVTQALTGIIGLIVIGLQGRPLTRLLEPPDSAEWLLFGAGAALAVLMGEALITRLVPEHVLDDGGVNERLFKARPIWHIALISAAAAVCEELLFRGAIQHAWGAYWTSVLFAAIHIRYWRHWLMTGLVFSVSYGLGWIYEHSGTLWAPILAHFLIDFAGGCMIRYGRKS